MIYLVWVLIFVAGCLFSDLKERKIYLWWCIANALAGSCANFIFRDHSFGDLAFGTIIGCSFILIGILTKEKIGIGDGVIILTIGLIAGGFVSFSVTVWAFVICTLCSMGFMLFLKKSWHSSIPFTPYVLIGSVITLWLQEW